MHKLYYIFVFTLLSYNIIAQQDLGYENEKINEATIDDKKWEEITNGKSFGEESVKKEEEKVTEDNSKPRPISSSKEIPFFSSTLGYIILFTLIISVLGLIIYLLIRQNIGMGNKKVKNIQYDVNVLDAETPEDELENYLKIAYDNNNYRDAIRMYYLLIMRSLASQGLINWAKEKTNIDYLFELYQHKYYLPFKNITLNFENVWYGENEIDNTQFEKLSIQFKSFLKKINTTNEK